MHRGSLEKPLALAFDRETQAYCVDDRGPRGSEHSNKAKRFVAATVHHVTDMMAVCNLLVYRDGHGGTRGSEHSRQSRASHGGDWPPIWGRDGHLSSIW